MKHSARMWVMAGLLAAGPGMTAGGVAAAEAGVPADTLVVPISGVEVTALKGRDRLQDIPAAAFVLSRDDIRRAGSTRLSTLLQTVPGLFSYGETSSGDATIVDPRGFTASGESSYLKLLVDGRDVRDLENGNVDWDWVAPGAIERIEVVQGPGAWAYGDASEGGIVNVVRAPLAGRFSSRAQARGGSFGLRGGDAGVSGPWGAVSLGASALAREVDGWRTHSRERVYGGSGEAVTQRSGREWRLDLSVLDANRQEPGALTQQDFDADPANADSRIDFKHSRRGRLGVSVQASPGPEPAWAFKPYVSQDDADQVQTLFFQSQFHHTLGTTGGASLGWHHHSTVQGARVVWQGEVTGEQSRLRSYYDSFDPDLGRGAQLASTRSTRTLGAVTAGARVELDARTVARLSVRGDVAQVHSSDDVAGNRTKTRTLRAFSPLLGLTRQVGSHGTAYGNVSTAFRVPTLFQLYDQRPFFFGPSALLISNGQLDPQTAVNLELGGRWDRGDGWSAQLGGYSTRVRNEIDFDLNSLSYANISKSWHRGIEASLACPLPGRFAARFGGSYTPTTFDGGDHDGRQINGVPLGTGSASLNWSPQAWWSVEAGSRLIGRRFLDKDEAQPLGAVAVWDLGAQAHTGRIHAGARLQNLFDRRYAESGFIGGFGEQRFLPAAPRGVSVTLSLE